MRNIKKIRPFWGGVLVGILAIFYMYNAITVQHLQYKFKIIGWGGTFNVALIKGFPAYQLCFIVGIIMMFILLYIRKSLYQVSIYVPIALTIILSILGFLGAKLLYILENLKTVNIKETLISFGGLSFYGALLLIPIIFIAFSRITNIDYQKILDYSAPAGLIMITFMRFGCFFKGCCAGIQLWINHNPVIIPTQLIECSFDLFLLNYILYAENKDKFNGRRYSIFLLIYGIYRFFIEFIRNTKPIFLNMSNGQIMSLITIVLAIIYNQFYCKNRNTNIKYERE